MRITQTRDQIAAALRVLGLPTGAIVFVHSSMSSIGYVEGGADSIVDAFCASSARRALSSCQPSPLLMQGAPTLSLTLPVIPQRWAASLK